MKPIGEVFLESQELNAQDRERWPRIRTGEREPIDRRLRLGVLRRDDFCCRKCHRSGDHLDLELDHIVPWSAGGPDTSENLRVLCSTCNTNRSNWRDRAHLRPVLPVTWWCVECWTVDTIYGRGPMNAPDWHYLNPPWRIDPELATTIAFCASCRFISRTDVVL